MTPKTTILVPTIGRMAYLPETRRCVSAQRRKDFRVLVLDNASPPEAQRFFADWASEDPRVEIRRVDDRLPMFTNFNRGIRAVETELFTFFHDDDVYLPEFLETLVGELERDPRAAFAGSNNDFIDEHGAVTERRRWIKRTESWPARRYVEDLVSRGRNIVPMQGLVFRRDAFGPEGFDTSLPIHFGDYVLLMRAVEDRGMICVADPVMQVRRHGAQASQIPMSRGIGMRTEVMSAFLDEYAARHPAERDLVARLRRRVALAHRVGLVWGWLNAADDAERVACLEGLGGHTSDAMLRTLLRTAERGGLRPKKVGSLVRAARVAAEALRL